MEYIIRNTSGANFPGSLSYRGPESKKGYPSMEEAEKRLHEVNAHYNAKHGQGLPLVVEERKGAKQIFPYAVMDFNQEGFNAPWSVHKTLEAAEKEAARMNKGNPNMRHEVVQWAKGPRDRERPECCVKP